MTFRVRYHDKAVMVGEVITVVLACFSHIISQRVWKIAQITQRKGVLSIEQLTRENKTSRRFSIKIVALWIISHI